MTKVPKIAIVPCKANSSRLTNKNFLVLDGKPLWQHTTSFLQTLSLDKIIISTDNIDLFPEVDSSIEFHKRQNNFLLEKHAYYVVESVINELLSSYPLSTIVIMALPTAPFRKISPFRLAFDMISENHESIVGIKKSTLLPSSYRTYSEVTNKIEPFLNQDINIVKYQQSTDEKYYQVTGSLFCSTISSLLTHKSFHTQSTYGIVLDEYESFDINTPLDFQFAEYLINSQQ